MDSNDFFNKFNGTRKRALKALVKYFENPTDQEARDKVASTFNVDWDVLDVLLPPLRETLIQLRKEAGDGPSFEFSIDTSLGVPAYKLTPSDFEDSEEYDEYGDSDDDLEDDDEYEDSDDDLEDDDEYEDKYPEPTYDPDADSDDEDQEQPQLPPALRKLLIQLKRSLEGRANGSDDSSSDGSEEKTVRTPQVFVFKSPEAEKIIEDMKKKYDREHNISEDDDEFDDDEIDDDELNDDENVEEESSANSFSDDSDDEAEDEDDEEETSEEEDEERIFGRMRSLVQSFMSDFRATEYDKSYWELIGDKETINAYDEIEDDGDPNGYFKVCRGIRRLLGQLSIVGLLDEHANVGENVRREAKADDVWRVWSAFESWVRRLVSMRVLEDDWIENLASIYDADDDDADDEDVEEEIDASESELADKNQELDQEAQLALLKTRVDRLENTIGFTLGKVASKERREALEELRKRRYFDLDKAIAKCGFFRMPEDKYREFYKKLEENRPVIPAPKDEKKNAAEKKSALFEIGFESGYDRGVREARARMIVKLLETFSAEEICSKTELKSLGITSEEIEYAQKWLETDEDAKDRDDRIDFGK